MRPGPFALACGLALLPTLAPAQTMPQTVPQTMPQTGHQAGHQPMARQGVPPLDVRHLHASSFDVRGFDPLGLPEAAAAAPVMAAPATLAPAREAHAELTGEAAQGARPFFSDGWRRDGVGAVR